MQHFSIIGLVRGEEAFKFEHIQNVPRGNSKTSIFSLERAKLSKHVWNIVLESNTMFHSWSLGGVT